METTLTLNLEIKKDIARELIRSKNEQLHLLLREQKEKLDNANQEDIDKGDLESPKQQMMDEIELQASRLDYLTADIQALKRLDLQKAHERVSYGSLIRANTGYFFVGVASEKIVVEDKKVVGISTHSPLFQKMDGLGVNTEFHLGKTEYYIFEII